MRRSRTLGLTAGLLFAACAPPAGAVVLLDTGLQQSVNALSVSTHEGFTCGPSRCEQDYEVYSQAASRFTLTAGGVATAFTFVAAHADDGRIAIYRAENGGLRADPAHEVWSTWIDSYSGRVDLGLDPERRPMPLAQLTYSGFSVPLDAGAYWVQLWTPFPTFGRTIVLKAGSDLGRKATRTFASNSAAGRTWTYATGPQVAIRIDASSVTPWSGTPEPAAWALMILGFGFVGATARRRRAARL